MWQSDGTLWVSLKVKKGGQRHSPLDVGKHQNLRGIVGQEEGAGAGG